MSSAAAVVTDTAKSAQKKANTLLYAFLVLFIVAVVIVFIGTFAYFVSQTNQYKKACTSLKPKASLFGIIMWVIGGALVLISIGLLVLYFINKSKPVPI